MAENESRSQKTLQDILKMSVNLSEAESVELKPTPEMGEERKEFLQNAIATVLENDEAKRLAFVTACLLQRKVSDVLTEDQLKELSDLFEELNYLLEGMDMPINFQKQGGLKHTLSLLRSNYSSVQWRAADIIANCVQNIPQNQYDIIENKGLESLLYVLRKTDVDMVRVKCLYALSTLIGGNNAGEKLFIDLKGVSIIMGLFTDENPKIRLKSAFLIRKIITSDSETYKYINNKTYIVLRLISVLQMEHDDSHEIVADILLHVIELDENALYEFKRSGLNELLNTRKNELQEKDSEKYQELIEIYDNLMGKL